MFSAETELLAGIGGSVDAKGGDMSESVFTAIYRYWVWIGGPVIVVALVVLILLIRGMVALVRDSHLVRLPLSEYQEVQFAEAGSVVLSTEGPRLSARFAKASFELSGMNGELVPGRRTLFGARTSGVSTVQTEIMTYEIPAPGRYVLRISGLVLAQENDTKHAVVFTRPHMGRIALMIVGSILVFSVFLVSLIFFLLRLLEARSQT
jgi:hypothetical protein